MEEAVEICKLRLFLKLAAQVEPDASTDNLGIEPLPDIDFNIRAGNTLVGYATKEEVQRCMKEVGGGQMKLMDEDDLGSFARFNTRCADVEQAFAKFRQLQTEGDGSVPARRQAGTSETAQSAGRRTQPLPRGRIRREGERQSRLRQVGENATNHFTGSSSFTVLSPAAASMSSSAIRLTSN